MMIKYRYFFFNWTFEKKYIDKIIISGNTRTLDKVIRRRLRVAEGDSYNRVLLKRSRILVNNLGHFSKVEFNQSENPENLNEIDINIEVEETSTGEFSLGGVIHQQMERKLQWFIWK